MNHFVVAGKLGRAHGLEGFLVFQSFSGETEHLLGLDSLTLRLESREVTLRVRRWERKGHLLLVGFEGYPSPETARRWTNWEVLIPRREAAPLGRDEYYVADLIGCRLVHAEGALAEVTGWFDGPQSVLLEARLADGSTRLVPFHREYLGVVDLTAKTIELLTPWILE